MSRTRVDVIGNLDNVIGFIKKYNPDFNPSQIKLGTNVVDFVKNKDIQITKEMLEFNLFSRYTYILNTLKKYPKRFSKDDLARLIKLEIIPGYSDEKIEQILSILDELVNEYKIDFSNEFFKKYLEKITVRSILNKFRGYNDLPQYWDRFKKEYLNIGLHLRYIKLYCIIDDEFNKKYKSRFEKYIDIPENDELNKEPVQSNKKERRYIKKTNFPNNGNMEDLIQTRTLDESNVKLFLIECLFNKNLIDLKTDELMPTDTLKTLEEKKKKKTGIINRYKSLLGNVPILPLLIWYYVQREVKKIKEVDISEFPKMLRTQKIENNKEKDVLEKIKEILNYKPLSFIVQFIFINMNEIIEKEPKICDLISSYNKNLSDLNKIFNDYIKDNISRVISKGEKKLYVNSTIDIDIDTNDIKHTISIYLFALILRYSIKRDEGDGGFVIEQEKLEQIDLYNKYAQDKDRSPNSSIYAAISYWLKRKFDLANWIYMYTKQVDAYILSRKIDTKITKAEEIKKAIQDTHLRDVLLAQRVLDNYIGSEKYNGQL